MVSKYLKLEGEWRSPGGDKKTFQIDNTPTISWWSKRKGPTI